MQIYAESNITIQGCTFSHGYGLYGGALFVLGETIINLYDTKFTNNIAYVTGGAIQAESFNSISISGETSFLNNKALNGIGDSIYASASLNSIFLQDTIFSSDYSSNFLTIDRVTTFYMKRSILSLTS